jgi:hypothetical protein
MFAVFDALKVIDMIPFEVYVESEDITKDAVEFAE